MRDFVILGVDPGYSISGYAIVSCKNGKTQVIDYGFLKLKSTDSLKSRTGQFYEFFKKIIEKFNIKSISIETSFLGKNAQTFLKLGYLRGILYLLSDQNGLEIDEFTPRQVKQSVTGFGGATKEQVAEMILSMIPGLNRMPKIEKNDVTDALAISICALWKRQQSNF